MKNLTPALRRSPLLQVLILVFLTPGLILMPIQVGANPMDPKVVAGNVNFQGLGTAALDINNASQAAIINWQSFSIGAGEITQINQAAGAFTLNRVVSGNPSAIYGQLRAANGGVAVINPNGIVVGPGGVVDVAGMMVMSTLDINNDDFLNGGPNRFKGDSSAGISNYGSITSQNGDVVVLANFLQNAGSVSAPKGTVAFGAGGDILVDQGPNGTTISVQSGGRGGAVGIDNSGTVNAASAELKAHGNVYALAIQNDGLVRASGYNFRGGKLTLSAGSSSRIMNTGTLQARTSDGRGGQINIEGGNVNLAAGKVDASAELGRDGGRVDVRAADLTVGSDASIVADGVKGGTVSLDATGAMNMAGTVSSRGSFGDGGRVDLAGNQVTVAATAKVDASGLNGGQVRVGGGFQGNDSDIKNSASTTVSEGGLLIADGELGDGGKVILWSDGDTMFAGEVSAQATGGIGNGGFVEVSGKNQLSYAGRVNTSAANGLTGTLLLDPTDVIIGESGASLTMLAASLMAALLQNNLVISTSGSGGNGDITILSGSDIQYDSPNSLTFLAHRNIFVNGDVKNHGTTDTAWAGTGHITMVAGWDGTNLGGFSTNINAADILSGQYGANGTNSGSIFLNDQALEPVEVGSARGETNAFGDLFLLTAGDGSGEFTQFGYRRENDMRGLAISGLGLDGLIGTADDVLIRTGLDLDFDTGVTGNINVHSHSGVLMLQHQGANVDEGVKDVDRSYVMIGHGGLRENDNDIDARGVVVNLTTGLTDYGSDSGDVSIGNGDNHGNITINTGGVLIMQAARAEGFAQIGHGGLANDDPDTSRANTVSESGRGDNSVQNVHIFGNMTGDIVVTASAIDMEGGRYNDAYVMIGNGGTRVRGEHAGDITVKTTGGGIRARAAPDSATGGPANANDWRWQNNRDQSFAQIGHGGFDSDFLFLDSLAGWDGTKTNAVVATTGVNRDRGAYNTGGNVSRPDDTNGAFMDANPNRTTILNTGDPDGGGALVAGLNSVGSTSHAGDGISINRVRGTYSDTAAHTVNGVAGGVTNRSFGHNGDITITSAGGVRFEASNGEDAYAMVGHGGRSTQGDHFGDITVNAKSDIIFTREAHQVNARGRDISNRGNQAHVQIGHGGTFYVGGATGDIYVNAAGGNVEFYAGRNLAHAQVGHGGRGEDGSTWSGGRQRNGFANGTHSGDITVIASGDIKFRSGFTDVQAHSMIGHGGYYQFADVLQTNDPNRLGQTPFGGGASDADQVGHNGKIVVNSGGNISFIAGQDELLIGQTFQEQNGGDNFTMIGHGGRNSKGDHSGLIDVRATGNMNIEARGGWDAVTIENIGASANDSTGTPRLNSTEDFGRTGYRNFAQLGHGGYDSDHVNTDNTNNWNNSGVNGDGIGTAGSADITMTIGGNFTALAAMAASTANKPMPILILDGPLTAGNPGNNGQNDYVTEGQVVFDNLVLGMASKVTLSAPTAVTLTGDGTATVAQLIAAYNLANPGNQISVLGGNTNQVPDSGASLAFSTTVAPGQFFSRFSGRLETVTRADGEIWNMPDPVLSAEEGYVQIGNGGRATDYLGSGGARTGGGTGAGTATNIVDGRGHRGDITMNVGGNIRLEAGDIKPAVSTGQVLAIDVIAGYTGAGAVNAATRNDLDGTGAHFVGPAVGPDADLINDRSEQRAASQALRNYAMIGLGGAESRGDHSGAITITGGGNLDLIAGEANRAFAMIGSGGIDSDALNNDGLRASDIGQRATINIDIAGKLTMMGGGLQNADTAGFATSVFTAISGGITEYAFVQIGAGGALSGGDHHADINILTGGPSLVGGAYLEAGNNTLLPYAQIGSGGYAGRSKNVSGNVSVVARSGDIILKGSVPVVDGLDDLRDPANPGNIGIGQDAYVQIGNGGFDTDAQGGNQNNSRDNGGYTGDITVVAATGSVSMTAGGNNLINQDIDDRFRGKTVQIGNGGAHSDGNASGNIRVAAGDDLTIIGGRASRHAYAMIGHGGVNTDGHYSGDIDIEVVDDVFMERGSTRDANNFFVRHAFAKIGHSTPTFTEEAGAQYNDGVGTRSGHITVSVGDSLTMVNGVNQQKTGATFVTNEVFATNATTSGTAYTLARKVTTPTLNLPTGTVYMTTSTGGTPSTNATTYVDDGLGNLVQYNTTTRFGTIDYTTGVITLTANLSGINPRVHYSVNSDSALVATTNAFGAQIGHLDPARTNDLAIGQLGNTFIGVSRLNPVTGTGFINASSGSVFSSADGGLTTELRFYMPSVAQDQIATGAFVNSANYSRTSLGGVGNRLGTDEHIATDHTMTFTGTYGEPVGTFVPEGVYPFHALGLYNVYFADTTVPPVIPPVIPPTPVIPPRVLTEAERLAAEAQRDRDDYESYDLVNDEDGEDDADGDGESDDDSEEDDTDDELVGGGRIGYQGFDPSTNRYSSYRVFGTPRVMLEEITFSGTLNVPGGTLPAGGPAAGAAPAGIAPAGVTP